MRLWPRFSDVRLHTCQVSCGGGWCKGSRNSYLHDTTKVMRNMQREPKLLSAVEDKMEKRKRGPWGGMWVVRQLAASTTHRRPPTRLYHPPQGRRKRPLLLERAAIFLHESGAHPKEKVRFLRAANLVRGGPDPPQGMRERPLLL